MNFHLNAVLPSDGFLQMESMTASCDDEVEYEGKQVAQEWEARRISPYLLKSLIRTICK